MLLSICAAAASGIGALFHSQNKYHGMALFALFIVTGIVQYATNSHLNAEVCLALNELISPRFFQMKVLLMTMLTIQWLIICKNVCKVEEKLGHLLIFCLLFTSAVGGD